MSIVANTYAHVIGVDTHAQTHTVALIDPSTAAVTAVQSFATSPAGLKRALSWITRHTVTLAATLVVIEGIGSYGAGIARLATAAGLRVVEPSPIAKALRSGRGKSDPIDAELIARSVLAIDTDRLRVPRSDQGQRAAIRTLLAARDQLTAHRTTVVNMLTALLRTTTLGFEVDARACLTITQIRTIAAWRERTEPIATAIDRSEARRLARAILAADIDLKDNKALIHTLLPATPAAVLLPEAGIGPITAATIYTSWSHAGRIHSEAAFASLAGVSPLPASSGNTTRHRLNRGGDRRLNAALHTITLTRMRIDPDTRAYIARRQAQGLTTKEIRRILKRYIARHLYRTLTTASANTPA